MTSDYWDDLDRHTGLDEIWLSHPLVRRRVNERITGSADTWPTAWLAERLGDRRPLERTLSLGCGIGNLERDLAAKGIVARCLGVDLSASCVDEARRRAGDAGLGERLRYERRDARAALAGADGLDAVFFHGSLHHFQGHEELLRLVARALRPGGILYLDEYVGPARDEWRLRDLVWPNAVYRLLPPALRRARLVRAPVNREDPTEAVESSRILPALETVFPERTIRRDYGGNLLAVLYPNLHRPPPGNPERRVLDRAVSLLLDLEDAILRHRPLLGAETFFTVALAER